MSWLVWWTTFGFCPTISAASNSGSQGLRYAAHTAGSSPWPLGMLAVKLYVPYPYSAVDSTRPE